MAIPVQLSSFDHSKEKILPASVLGDLLPDKIVCPVFCEWDTQSLLEHLCSNAWILLSRSAMSVQLSHLYDRMETTSAFYIFNFTGKLIELLFQMTLSFVMENVARLSRVFTSLIELPSLVRVEPRYLKLSTSSNFCPFSMMQVGAGWLWLFTIILLYSMLTSMPCAPAALSSLVVRFWSSTSLPPTRLMPCAKRRLHNRCPLMEMDVWKLWRVPCMVFSRQMLNRARERRHPCQTPKEVWKKSSHMMLRRTALFESLWSTMMTSMRLASKLKFSMTCHKLSCQTRSNAFLKSMKLW